MYAAQGILKRLNGYLLHRSSTIQQGNLKQHKACDLCVLANDA